MPRMAKFLGVFIMMVVLVIGVVALVGCSGGGETQMVEPDPNLIDTDGDGLVDIIDPCPTNPAPSHDTDGDQVGDLCDNCPAVVNIDQGDDDLDSVGNACDNCRIVANTDQADANRNGIGNACDTSP